MSSTRSRWRFAAHALAGAAILLVATGCGAEVESAEGGMGLPVVSWLTDPPSGGEQVQGTMRVADNGCFHLESGTEHRFVVWPDGFEHDGDQVRTDSGTPLRDGDELSGTGTMVTAAAAAEAGGGKDSQLAQAVGYCAADVDVVILTEVSAG